MRAIHSTISSLNVIVSKYHVKNRKYELASQIYISLRSRNDISKQASH
jgi:hypothetical protein